MSQRLDEMTSSSTNDHLAKDMYMESMSKERKPATDNRVGLKDLGRTLVRALLFWVPLGCVAFEIWRSSLFGGWDRFWLNTLMDIVIGNVAAATCIIGVFGVRSIQERILRYQNKPPVEHSTLGSLAVIALMMVPGVVLGNLAAGGLIYLFGGDYSPPSFKGYRDAIFVGLLIGGAIFTFERIAELNRSKLADRIRMHKLENERLRASFAALSAQMNPHLLFNSLNTIASLIPSEPEAAEQMTVELADFLRYVLGANKLESHSLAQEMELCDKYLDIQKHRLGNRLNVTVSVGENVDTKKVSVPPLVVQPLLENAIKYAIAPRTEGGNVEIRVRAGDSILEVSINDDGPGMGRSAGTPGTGSGIENVRKRLELEYGDRGGLHVSDRPEGGAGVSIRIPFVSD